MFILLNERNGIFKIIFILISAINKISLKYQIRFNLSLKKKWLKLSY